MATLRQKMAVQKIVENQGNVSKAMLESGYKPVTAKNPKNLTESDGFKELMDEYLPDDLLAKVHREGLEAKKVVSARAKTKHGDPMDANEDTDDFIEVEDHPTRHKFLELGYKVKGKLTGDATSPTNIIVPIVVLHGDPRANQTEGNNPPPEAV